MTIKHYRKDVLVNSYTTHNMVVNVGLNNILDVMFHGTSQTSTWYIGLITETGSEVLSANDTMASHAGWGELTGYSQATRVAWTEGAASGQEIVSTAASSFSINATGRVFGSFVTSDSAKSGTAGTLWSTYDNVAYFDVVNGETVTVEYKVAIS